jgi:iron complex transport system permease protein
MIKSGGLLWAGLGAGVLIALSVAVFWGADALPLIGPARDMILWEVRLPRALAALCAGAALGASGAALQGLLRNPLADPGVLGVSGCASLAAVCVLAFAPGAAAAGWTAPAAVLGALGATALLALAAQRVSSVVSLLLVGVGVSSLAGALTALAMNLAPNPFALSDLINWLLGSVAHRSVADLTMAAPFLVLGFAFLRASQRGLTALSLGEEAAAGIGLNTARVRVGVVIGAGLCAGAAVGLAGAIGFVGLIAGHVARPWVGHDPGRALAPAALLGAIILLFADGLVRIAPGDQDVRLGVAAALLGAPAFIWIALRRGGGGHD